MNSGSGQNFDCRPSEIAAYIDGELERSREFELETHFASCEVCFHEMNRQKQFLCGLNSCLQKERDPELPPNFTKLIVVGAESTVSGLRRPMERFNAIFICLGLALFALFTLGAEAGNMLAGVSGIFDRLAAIGGFFAHLIYSVFIGVAIILRSLAAQVRFDPGLAGVLSVMLAVSLMFVSRKVLRMRSA